jgi:hypothetical protein
VETVTLRRLAFGRQATAAAKNYSAGVECPVISNTNRLALGSSSHRWISITRFEAGRIRRTCTHSKLLLMKPTNQKEPLFLQATCPDGRRLRYCRAAFAAGARSNHGVACTKTQSIAGGPILLVLPARIAPSTTETAPSLTALLQLHVNIPSHNGGI